MERVQTATSNSYVIQETMYFKPPPINELTVNASVNISNYKSIQQKEIVNKITAKRNSAVNQTMNLDLF
jgi:hypothetical protein